MSSFFLVNSLTTPIHIEKKHSLLEWVKLQILVLANVTFFSRKMSSVKDENIFLMLREAANRHVIISNSSFST